MRARAKRVNVAAVAAEAYLHLARVSLANEPLRIGQRECLMEEIQQVRKRVEFRLNKQSLHDVRVEDAEVEDVAAQGTTAVCCWGCNTGTTTTSGCPADT